MTPAAACAAYFREHPDFDRLLRQMLAKYRSYGCARGTVLLRDATEAECDAARSWFGRPFTAPLRFSLLEFEGALHQTRFGEATLQAVLECYFDTVIETKREQTQALEQYLTQLLESVQQQVASDVCRTWLRALSQERTDGYGLLRKNPTEAETALLLACRSLEWLEAHPGQWVRLAVLSANATTDPHALDGNTLSGKLFLHLLAHANGAAIPASTEERAALYDRFGILQDSISSTVTQVGLYLYRGADEHPAQQAFRRLFEASTLTLSNLSGITRAESPSGHVYLVENQMVFSQLCDHAQQFHSPLICTSGQPTVAVLQLLDLLSMSGTILHYSGDFDGKGLSIAMQLLQRYEKQLPLWHMTPADYALAQSDVSLRLPSKALLENCTISALEATAKAILNCGKVGYQELLIPQLLTDLTTTP